MKKFLLYLKNSNLATIFLCVIVCFTVFRFRESIELKQQTITFVNLVMFGVLVTLCFNSIRRRYDQRRYILYLLLVIFIFNRFYDEIIFYRVFHFELLYFVLFVGTVVLIVIIYPFLREKVEVIIRLVSHMFEAWTNNKIDRDEKFRQKDIITQGKNGKRNKIKEVPDSKHTTVNIQHKENTEKIEEKYDRKKRKFRSADNASHPFLFLLIFFLLLSITVILFLFVTKQDSTVIQKISSENLFTVAVSVAVAVVMLVFMAGIILSLLIKWIQIITDIITKQHRGEIYFVYACCLFIVSQYFFDNYSNSTDDFVDLILNGRLFTFPLVLSILTPVFLIFTESIIEFTKKNELIENALKECAEQVLDIAKSIIKSLLLFIQFVTSDYLSAIIELTEEECIEYESQDVNIRKTDSKNQGKNQDEFSNMDFEENVEKSDIGSEEQ